MSNQRPQPQHVPATLPRQESQAFTRTVCAPADADMIKLPQAQAMDGEAPAADEAGDFVEGVERHSCTGANAQDPDAVGRRRPH
jgi:hypothetical protein